MDIVELNSEKWLSIENLPKERWEYINDTDNMYQVSNYGRIKTLKRKEKILLLKPQGNGYIFVRLWKRCKIKFHLVHRLVYQYFIGELKEDLVIDHIDGNKANNRYDNLQQISSRDNTSKAVKSKYSHGVRYIQKGNRYTASINVKFKRYYLGSYKTQEEAENAYNRAKVLYQEFGELPIEKKKEINRVKDGYKVCSVCKINKPVSEYTLTKGKCYSACKECVNLKRREKLAQERGDKPLNMHRKTWDKIKNKLGVEYIITKDDEYKN